MAKKGKSIPVSANPKPRLSLYDNQIVSKKANLGDKVTYLVTGKVTSMSEDKYDGKKHTSQGIEISRIKKQKK